MTDINKTEKNQSLYAFFSIVFILEFFAALVIRATYNNFVLFFDLKEAGWSLFSLFSCFLFALIALLFIAVNFYVNAETIKDKKQKIKSMKQSGILMILMFIFVFYIIPPYNQQEYIYEKYTDLIEDFRKNPELNTKVGRLPGYPIDIHPQVYERNKSYVELMDGFKRLDPKIYHKYSDTNARYDLFLAKPFQQRHVLVLMSLNDKRISDALITYMDDKFLSIGEYRRFIQGLLNDGIITTQQANEKF